MPAGNVFSKIAANRFNRKFGGNTAQAEPYLTGTHFVYFDALPSGIMNHLEGTGIESLQQVQEILSATCMSVTPPGGTLSVFDYSGLGGIKWGVPGNIDYGNTVSVKFTEFSGLPLFNIFHSWFKLIRDYRTGVSNLVNNNYNRTGYSCILYYWTTDPSATKIEYYACYDAVFPTKDPQDLFSSDVESVGKLEVEIEFHIDTPYHEPWVKQKVETFHSNLSNVRGNIENFSY